MNRLEIAPPAARYLKKLKDKHLKQRFFEAITLISEDPLIGEAKVGDLAGIYCYDFHYNKTNYELAYAIRQMNNTTVIVIMAGPRENFYDGLKRYWNK